MNTHLFRFTAGVFGIMLAALSIGRAGDMKKELDPGPDLKLFDSQFSKYPLPAKAIATDAQGVRFYLSSATQKPEPTGLYSFFKLAGDFEVSAEFAWTPVVTPKGGYGVSCGIAIETSDQNKSVALARGNFPGKKSAYVVVEGKNAVRGIVYTEQHFPTELKTGRLVLRRKHKDLICLATNDTGELEELCRFKAFTDATVQKVRIYADPGNAPTDMDARISGFKVRADEITHDRTKAELRGGWGWWLAGAALVVGAVLGYFAFRRVRHGQWGWSRGDD